MEEVVLRLEELLFPLIDDVAVLSVASGGPSTAWQIFRHVTEELPGRSSAEATVRSGCCALAFYSERVQQGREPNTMKYRINRRVVAAMLMSTTATTLAACGPAGSDADSKSSVDADSVSPGAANPEDSFGGLTGAQISDRSKDALRRATSLRVSGDMPNPRTGGTVTLDIVLDTTGSCRGAVTMPGAGTLNVIRGPEAYFIQGDEGYWRMAVATAAKNRPDAQVNAFLKAVKGRWIKASENTAETSLPSKMCDLAAMTNQFGADLSKATERGADVTRDGQKLAVIFNRDGNEVVTTYISKGIRPYPVEITATGGRASMDVKFTDYGKPVDTTPPPADQIIDSGKAGLPPNRRS
ncbi:hypothetical protein [Streptomyces sp. NPDC088707]|uniref:hypothetical protein n=1 Tax=Streptomyces sp. NPDC088707 TaxID=3365871 RepID=UPI003825A17C